MQPIRQFGIDFRWSLFFVITACSTKPIVVSEHEVSTPASPIEINAKPEIAEPETPTCKPSELGPRYFLELQLSPLDPRQAALKRSTSIRLPGDAKPADHWLGGGLPERCKGLGSMAQCPAIRIDLLDDQPVRITTCEPMLAEAELLHVYFGGHSFPTSFNQLGRNIDQILKTCGLGLKSGLPAPIEPEDFVHYQLAADHTNCEIGVAVRRSTDEAANYYFGVMKGRTTENQIFEWQFVLFVVPEDQWTDEVADIIRASARSFEVDWDAVDARRKLDLLIDSERTRETLRQQRKKRRKSKKN